MQPGVQAVKITIQIGYLDLYDGWILVYWTFKNCRPNALWMVKS